MCKRWKVEVELYIDLKVKVVKYDNSRDYENSEFK